MAPTSAPKKLIGAGRGIIDVHSHALPPLWVDAAAKATRIPRDKLQIAGAPVPEWSVEKHLAMMDAHGVAACVLSQPGATVFLKGQPARDLARAMNEEFASIIARHPKRFAAFAVMPLDDIDACNDEMAYALDVLKLDGIACSTNVDGVYLGNPRYDSWFAEMNRRKVTLFVHPSVPPGFDPSAIGINPSILEFPFDSTRMVVNMVLSGAKKRFSDVRMISTHGGGTVPYLTFRIGLLELEFGSGPGRPMMSAEEVQAGVSSFYFDLTASAAAAQLDAIRHLVPASQLMLGFDYPMMLEETIGLVWEKFETYPKFTPGERYDIIQGTALSLLPALAGRISGRIEELRKRA
jgi:predicted TIM-barrel fold metal-dependent hydrolase